MSKDQTEGMREGGGVKKVGYNEIVEKAKVREFGWNGTGLGIQSVHCN